MARRAASGRVICYLPGILLLLCVAGWTFLSFYFTYGEGHAERPIVEYLISYWAAWLAFALSIWTLFRDRLPPLHWVLLVAVAARLILLPSNLIQENDVYRYILDGQVLRHGGNPYQYPPLAYPEIAEGTLSRSLEQEEAQLVLSRISYSYIPTVYPPAAQFFFALGTTIGDWDWRAQRLVFLAADLAAIWLLMHLLAGFSRPREWILIYAWNPLILKEIVNSAHLDILVPLFSLAFLRALLRHEKSAGLKWLWIASSFLALAVLSKLYPLLLLPAFLVYAFRRDGWARAGLCGLIVGLVTLVGYLPFLGIGWSQLTAGLTTYAEEWRMNDGAFALFQLWTDNPRLVSSILVAGVASTLPLFLSFQKGVVQLAEAMFWILLVWFLLIPTPFPWYATGLLALAPLLVAPAVWMAVSVSGLTAVYYLSFVYEYHHLSESWWAWARGIEHGLLWICLAAALYWRIQKAGRAGDPAFSSRKSLLLCRSEPGQQQPPPS